jgi:MerR family Zn(II)-responsive transcriptional regulator of zntA
MLINEVAKTTGLPKDTIRYYTKLGLLEANERQAGSRKYADYDESIVEVIKVIKHAQKSGFTLQEIRLYLFDIMTGKMPPKEVVEILESKLSDVRAQQESLKETEVLLQDSISMFAKKAGQSTAD